MGLIFMFSLFVSPQSGTHFFCLSFLLSICLFAETFTKHFQKYGAITDSVIMKDKHTKMPRGFGFVTFSDPSVIDRVLEDEHVIDGRSVRHLCSTSKSCELNFGLYSDFLYLSRLKSKGLSQKRRCQQKMVLRQKRSLWVVSRHLLLKVVRDSEEFFFRAEAISPVCRIVIVFTNIKP
jgi:RNA recognition motif-containing protein